MLRYIHRLYCSRGCATAIRSPRQSYSKKASGSEKPAANPPSQLQQQKYEDRAMRLRDQKDARHQRHRQDLALEGEMLRSYPVDVSFLNELQWLGEGLLRTVGLSDNSAVPLIRIQHQSIAASSLQRQLAKVIAARLSLEFVELSSKMIQSVETARWNGAVDDKDSDMKRARNGAGNGDSLALSAILALQKQELASGLYTFSHTSGGMASKGGRRGAAKRALDTAPNDFVLFTIPALNQILEDHLKNGSDECQLLVYLTDYEELVHSARDKRLLSEFVENFNKIHRRALFMAPGYTGNIGGGTTMASGESSDQQPSSSATLNTDYKLSTTTVPNTATSQLYANSDAKYGPLWHPLPSTVSIQERCLLMAIPKPSDPRRALILRQSLSEDEAKLLFAYNLHGLIDTLNEMAIAHRLDADGTEAAEVEEFKKRAKTRNDFVRIALAAQGTVDGPGETLGIEHVQKALKSQPRYVPFGDSTDDSLSARFAHIIPIDQLNSYEKQLLRSCVTTPDMLQTRYDDVAGADDVKKTLDDLISKPIRHPHLFNRGILKASRSGILLFGPPGTGKTMLARAVAAESGATFVAIGPADLNSKWVGEGEKFARAVFTLARKLAPSVIFLDEIDALLESRDTASSRSSKVDILSELMSQWDGMWDVDNSHLVVMGATNRPYALDTACLRRLPRRLLVDLPDLEGRVGILKNLLREDRLGASIDLQAIAEKAGSFSGSDLKHLCQAAALMAANERGELDGIDVLVLERRHFDAALQRVSPSVSHSAPTLIKLRKWNTQYGLTNTAFRQASSIGFE